MFSIKKLFLAAFAITVVAVTGNQADAAFAIRILNSSGVEIARINDNVDPGPTPNTANFTDIDGTAININAATLVPLGTTFTLGNFTISGLVGSIGASGLNASSAALGLNITSNSAGSITFEFSRTGYTFPTGNLRSIADSFSTTAPGNVNSPVIPASVSYQSFINSDNLLFSSSGDTNGPIVVNPIPAGSQGTGLSVDPVSSTIPFSITTRSIFTFTAAAGDIGFNSRTDVTGTNASGNVVAVPAPAGLLLGLIGLPALAFARRFRRAAPVQA